VARDIPLSRGFTAIVDDEDYEYLSRYAWWADNLGYALTSVNQDGKKRNIRMHRMLTKAPIGSIVDHADGNPGNNQKSNLRVVTQSENLMNTRTRKNLSGFKGVGWYKHYQKWQARVHCKGRTYHIGYYDDPIEAARAYNVKARELFGEFARLNEIPGEVSA
jgi:hypothetical protein